MTELDERRVTKDFSAFFQFCKDRPAEAHALIRRYCTGDSAYPPDCAIFYLFGLLDMAFSTGDSAKLISIVERHKEFGPLFSPADYIGPRRRIAYRI